MALVYRAHFALIKAPIFTSEGQNMSAIYGFTNTLLDILNAQKPTHIAVAFDTPEKTGRHEIFPAYKAQREEIPEDIAYAIPQIIRMIEAFNIPVLTYPGHEADDVIGTFARIAEAEGFDSWMVTPDKDFAQLVSEKTVIYKPARMGNRMEVMDLEAVLEKWNVKEAGQVADILGLWGDASDNIPGVPGYGEKTAKKLIGEYGSVENLIEHAEDLKGKQKERLVDNREQALLSKKLATINREVPVTETLDAFALQARNDEALKSLFVEFEFNALGKRLFGDDFKAGRGHTVKSVHASGDDVQLAAELKTIEDVEHTYHHVQTPEAREELAATLAGLSSFCFDVETDDLDPKQARLVGIAISFKPHEAFYISLPRDEAESEAIVDVFRPVFENETIEKVGHNLKFDISVMTWNG
ncbi:MAG: 5'-3' exonuclease H3TH domain-containing protein, partial [Verrucomicrobiota bacterium]